MTKITITILAGMLLAAALPVVHADETKADCEDGQHWAGYTSTDQLRTLFYQLTDGHGAFVNNCEGEQWDGQDSVSTYHPTDAPCAPDPSVQDTAHPAVVYCMGNDPNAGSSNPITSGAIVPLRIRVTGDNEGTDRQQYYVGAQIGAVGWVVVYAGACSNQKEGTGLEGADSCGGSHQARQGVYLRDDTPNNVLATVVSAPGITKGYVSETDCDLATYQYGAEHNDRSLCGRDNTALGVEEILV